MKKFLAIVVAGAALASAPAFAADLPVKAAPMVAPAPVFSWTGFYLGAEGGWGEARTNWVNSAPPSGDFHGGGGFVGGTAGVNLQSGAWVFGIEGDYSWANLDPKTSNGVCGGGTTCETKLDRFATVRGRIGYTVTPTVLVYGTGGWAYGRLDNHFGASQFFRPSAHGWAAGAGVEAVIAGNWSAKIEYLHIDLGSPTVCSAALSCSPDILSPYKVDAVRVGLNYRFGGDPWGKAPVVARY